MRLVTGGNAQLLHASSGPVCSGPSLVPRRAGEDEGKLVALVARHEVTGTTNNGAQLLADEEQHFVASLAEEAIVEPLDVVTGNHQQ